MSAARCALVSAFTAALLAASTTRAEDGAVGLGLGYANRYDVGFVRGEFAIPLAERWVLVPNLQYLHAEGARHWISSVDVEFKLPWSLVDGRLRPFLGAGLGMRTIDPEGPTKTTTHDAQINFLGGVAFEGPVTTFVQVRSDAKRVDYMVGLRLTL